MSDKALCEPLVTSSVTATEEATYSPQEYSGQEYSSGQEYPPPEYTPFSSSPSYHVEAAQHVEATHGVEVAQHVEITPPSEEASASGDTKPVFEELSPCKFPRPAPWRQKTSSEADVKPQVLVKRESEMEYREGDGDGGGPGVIRCVETSMPPPDTHPYEHRGRRSSGEFARPMNVPREVIRGPHGARYRDARRSHDLPRPDQTRPPDLMRASDCPPPTPSSPSSPTTSSATGGRPRASGKKDRKKEEPDDVSSSIPDLGECWTCCVHGPLLPTTPRSALSPLLLSTPLTLLLPLSSSSLSTLPLLSLSTLSLLSISLPLVPPPSLSLLRSPPPQTFTGPVVFWLSLLCRRTF